MKQEKPFFSIIIPTFNRPAQIAACLQSLTNLDYPSNRFEVIVVDDGGKTPLNDVVSPFQNRLNLTLLTQSHRGPAFARNTGAFRANGDFLAFTDDDCLLDHNWLRNLAARFAAFPDHAVGGRTLNALPDNLYSAASQLIIKYLHACYNSDPYQAWFFTSNNLALPTTHFRMVGGFNSTFPQAAGEDREFCERWRHHGYRMTYAPEVLVYHTHVFNFCIFWRKHFTYGRGAYRYHQFRAQQGFGPFRPDPKFYIRLILSAFIHKQRKRVLRVAVLLMISQVANGLGFLWEGLNQHKRR